MRGAVGGTSRYGLARALFPVRPDRQAPYSNYRSTAQATSDWQNLGTALFTNREEGVWYDPSDLSTLFQDIYGEVPVTGLGQPVGLMLDKRLGPSSVLFGDELVSNGTFDDATGWTVSGDWFIAGGVAGRTASVLGGSLTTPISVIGGRTYLIAVDIVTETSGVNLRATFVGGTTSAQVGLAGVGRRFAFITAGEGNATLRLDSNSAWIGTFDNVSLREVVSSNGNHARQSNPASRPTLEARSNYLIQTEQFDGVAWAAVDATVTQGVEAPNGTMTAATVTATDANATLTQAFTVGLTTTHTFSLWIKRRTGTGTVEIQNGDGTWTAVTVTGDWERFQRTASVTAGTRTPGVRVTVNGDAVDVWGSQLEMNNTATTYQRVTSASDYEDIGLPRYLLFDGVDDRFSVPVNISVNVFSQGASIAIAFARDNVQAGTALSAFWGGASGVNGLTVLTRPDNRLTGCQIRTPAQGTPFNVILQFTAPAATVNVIASVCYGYTLLATSLVNKSLEVRRDVPSLVPSVFPISQFLITPSCRIFFYGGLFECRALTDAELTQVSSYYNEMSGGTA
jgi:hypothetical protein